LTSCTKDHMGHVSGTKITEKRDKRVNFSKTTDVTKDKRKMVDVNWV